MKQRRVSIFAGHYGSGKTNIALNFALRLKGSGLRTAVADLDIVNPYFRTKDAFRLLSAEGIRLIASDYAGSNVDVPALPGEAYSLIDDREQYCVIDVGGDDRGALALGRYAPSIKAEDSYDFYFVVNRFRPLTADVDKALGVLREIEAACDMRFTAVVSNPNLGAETTAKELLSSVGFAAELCDRAKLPLAFTAVTEELSEAVERQIPEVFPIKIFVTQE